MRPQRAECFFIVDVGRTESGNHSRLGVTTCTRHISTLYRSWIHTLRYVIK